MRRYQLHFRVEFSSPVALALAAPLEESDWDAVFRLATNLVEQLPGRVPFAGFLGSSAQFQVTAAGHFARDLPGHYQRNKGRPLLIKPLLECLGPDSPAMLAVISRCRPLDLEDWDGTAVEERIVLMDPAQGQLPSNVSEIVDNHVEQAVLTGCAFAPLEYRSRPAADFTLEFDRSEGAFRLSVRSSAPSLDLDVDALAADVPALHVHRAKSQHTVVPKEISSSEVPTVSLAARGDWRPVPNSVLSLVRAGIEGHRFRCPQCELEHPAGTFLCPSGDLLLQPLPAGSCLLFRCQAAGSIHHLRLTGPRVIGDCLRLLTHTGEIYDSMPGRGWRPLRRIRPFEEVERNVWALLYHV